MSTAKAKTAPVCTCLGTSRNGRWHAYHCPRYVASLKRVTAKGKQAMGLIASATGGQS
jgi:hypothetical protein